MSGYALHTLLRFKDDIDKRFGDNYNRLIYDTFDNKEEVEEKKKERGNHPPV